MDDDCLLPKLDWLAGRNEEGKTREETDDGENEDR